MSIERLFDPPIPAPVPAGYEPAALHFPRGTRHLRVLFQFGGVVVRDRAAFYHAQRGWKLRHVYVDPNVYDKLRYALACAGVGELRRKGDPRQAIHEIVRQHMEESMRDLSQHHRPSDRAQPVTAG